MPSRLAYTRAPHPVNRAVSAENDCIERPKSEIRNSLQRAKRGQAFKSETNSNGWKKVKTGERGVTRFLIPIFSNLFRISDFEIRIFLRLFPVPSSRMSDVPVPPIRRH